MRNFILSLITIFALAKNTNAQSGFEQALLGTSEDAGKLVGAYFAPGVEGFINGMNSGWYHTAKVHKTLGFDITIGASAAFIGKEKETFNIVNALGANSSITSSATTASTFAGPNTPTAFTVTQRLEVPGGYGTQEVTASFEMPGGITEDLPVKAMPAPSVQIGIGLPFKLDAMVRFFPKTGLGDDGGKISMFGIGLKKEITNWFGPMDKTPLHVSLLAAYTKLNINYELGNRTISALQVQNGAAEFALSAFTVQAIASLNFPFINFYGGLGYNSGNADLTMTGKYTGTYTYANPGGTPVTFTQDLTAPSLSFDSSGFRSTLGMRISLGFFKIFGSYTFQEYNTANLGIALSFR